MQSAAVAVAGMGYDRKSSPLRSVSGGSRFAVHEGAAAAPSAKTKGTRKRISFESVVYDLSRKIQV